MPPNVFADTFYWLALARPRDPWHVATVRWATANPSARIVTTDEVLTEFLNALGGMGPAGRYAAATVHDVRNDPDVDVLPQTRADFDAALALYEARPDKDYSLIDCRSMLAAARHHAITEVLTNDHHFTQEGFTILFLTP